jgi:hypothetical protein
VIKIINFEINPSEGGTPANEISTEAKTKSTKGWKLNFSKIFRVIFELIEK